MPPREMFVVICPLESVSALAGSKVTPGTAEKRTSAPATAVPCSSLTCTTRGCGSRAPVCAICFPPLDSMIVAPKAMGLGNATESLLWEQAEFNSKTHGSNSDVYWFISLQSPGEDSQPLLPWLNFLRSSATSRML